MIIWAGSTKQNSKQWKGGTECNLARRVEGACINNGARLGFGLAVSGGACHLRPALLVWIACMRVSPDARYASRRVGKPWTLIRAKDLQTMVSREGKQDLGDMSQ